MKEKNTNKYNETSGKGKVIKKGSNRKREKGMTNARKKKMGEGANKKKKMGRG